MSSFNPNNNPATEGLLLSFDRSRENESLFKEVNRDAVLKARRPNSKSSACFPKPWCQGHPLRRKELTQVSQGKLSWDSTNSKASYHEAHSTERLKDQVGRPEWRGSVYKFKAHSLKTEEWTGWLMHIGEDASRGEGPHCLVPGLCRVPVLISLCHFFFFFDSEVPRFRVDRNSADEGYPGPTQWMCRISEVCRRLQEISLVGWYGLHLTEDSWG